MYLRPSGRFIKSTPEPNSSGHREDICELVKWERDGSGSVLWLVSTDVKSSVQIRVPVTTSEHWYVGGHYKVRIIVEPLKDPLADEISLNAIHDMAIADGIGKLKTSGDVAVEIYRSFGGRLPEGTVDALREKAHQIGFVIGVLDILRPEGKTEQAAFLCKKPLTDKELRRFLL